MRSLFISYASADQAIAMEVCALLEARDVSCWVAPRDVTPGAQWDETLLHAIDEAGAFLLLLSASSNQSPFVKNEVNRAFAKQKAIFTFRIEDLAPSGSLEFYLARHHWIDGFPAPLDDKVERLAAAVKGSPLVTPPAATPRKRAMRMPWGRIVTYAGSMLVGALAVGAANWSMRGAGTVPGIVRTSIVLPGDVHLDDAVNLPLALSPDGARLVFGDGERLYVRSLDSFDAKPIPGTEGASSPFFSPDGQWIAFFSRATVSESSGALSLRKVSIRGGAPVTICDVVGAPNSGSWGPNGVIVYSPRAGSDGLWQVSDSGGQPRRITRAALDNALGRVMTPEVLPDGDAVLFSFVPNTGGGAPQIVSQSLKTGEHHVVAAGSQPHYAGNGALLSLSGSTLVAAPFDERAQVTTGSPVTLVDGVRRTGFGTGLFSVDRGGSLVYVPGDVEANTTRIVSVDRQGRAMALPAPARDYAHVEISPDGARAATTISDENGRLDVWVVELTSGMLTRLTFDGTSQYPVWTPDGRRLDYTTVRDGVETLVEQSADGSGPAQQLTHSKYPVVAEGWAPDGRTLLFHEIRNQDDIWMMPAGKYDRARPLIAGPRGELEARVSPDGRWIAYVSNESGKYQVYVQPVDVSGAKWQVSTVSGVEPRWGKGGRELYFRNGDAVMVVGVTRGSSFHGDAPRVLFSAALVPPTFPRGTFDVLADGERFVMLQPTQAAARANVINVIQDWPGELARSAGSR